MNPGFARICLLAVVLMSTTQCKKQPEYITYSADSPVFKYTGRVHMNDQRELELVSSAAAVQFRFSGDSVTVHLRNQAGGDDYNYVTIIVDSLVTGRFPVKGDDIRTLGIKAGHSPRMHHLSCVKATEAINGLLLFAGASATRIEAEEPSDRDQILFIGNSITCGRGGDTSEVPCGAGKWYDQHDAYYAYGPRLARMLGVDYVLNSVSGIGIYRRWNDDGPDMPLVYDHLYFDTTSSVEWDDHRVNPDIISIALGTNDLSPGDGIHARDPFNPEVFIRDYVDFAHRLYRRYPQARFILLSSPMESGANATELERCLAAVQSQLNNSYPDRHPVETFFFHSIDRPGGCSGHPSDHDHELMAQELEPAFRKLLGD